MDLPSITMQAIGVVRTPVHEAVDTNWGKVISELHIDPQYAAGLDGLSDWSHIIVIFHMHETSFDPERHLVRRPRERDDMPELGIFAQRARHRPNLIGISAVKLMGVEGDIVRVRGLDAIDGTPILDIKPYAPIYDGVQQEPLIPAWFFRLMQGYF